MHMSFGSGAEDAASRPCSTGPRSGHTQRCQRASRRIFAPPLTTPAEPPRRRAKFSRSLYCKPQSDAACTERHPHFDVVSRWVTGELASVLEPPRKHSKHRKHNNEIPFDSAALQMADTVRDAFRLRCVTDSQVQNLTECPNGRNTTLWLLQAQEAYEYNNAAASAPATCSCKHICNARCVQRPGSNEAPHCYMGPGLAAAWLILRAAGLATRPSHKIPMRV